MFLLIPWQAFAGASALAIALRNFLTKKALGREHSLQFALASHFFYAAVGIALLPFVDFTGASEVLPLVAAASAMGAVSGIFIAKSLRHLDLSSVTPLFNLSTLISIVLAILFLGETFSPVKGAGIVLMVAGAFLIERSQGPLKIVFRDRRQFYPFIPVVVLAIVYVMDKKILAVLSPLAYFSLFSIFHLLVSFTASHLWYGHAAGDIADAYKNDGTTLVWAGAAGIASSLVFYYALSLAPVSLVLPIMRSHSLIGVIMGGTFFHERAFGLRLAATVAILAGLYLIIR